jgi:hypothetical protein
MEEGEVILAAEVKDDELSTICGWKKQTLLMLGILSLLVIIGGVVGGVLSSKAVVPTPAPTTLKNALLDELMFLNATFEKYRWQFENAESPQFQALEWMKNDTIVMSSGRSTLDLLQRYVLAVLFYSANGPNWGWSKPYLSSDDVCSWNKGSDDYGVYCRLDGESIDELKLTDDSVVGLGLELPWELGLLTHLTMLQLDFNQITGTLPSQLGQLVSLKSLDLNFNLTGTIPAELGQLVSLESLDLSGNQLTGTIPTELDHLTSLTYLGMSDNQLTGTIPTELAQLTSLVELYMYINQLTGTIPTELVQLTSLGWLFMSSNQLTGTIPTELVQLTSLTSLVMSSNQLTGTIPTELGQLSSLVELYMSDNELTGTIPTELGQLTSLEWLVMSDNQLTGTIPTELGQLTSLTFLAMHNNRLTGSLEQSFCVENRTWEYGLSVDCDQVECSCCDCA